MRAVVLDTNVAVSAILWGGAPRKLLDLSDTGHIALFTSVDLLREFTCEAGANRLFRRRFLAHEKEMKRHDR